MTGYDGFSGRLKSSVRATNAHSSAPRAALHLGVDLVHMSAPFCNHSQAGAFPWQSSARPDDTISLRSKSLLANAIVSARAMNAKIQMVMVGMGGISARSQHGFRQEL
jgi:hypothetical protein